MIAQSTHRACQPPVAPIGSRVLLNLAVIFLHDEGCHGALTSYLGQHLLVKRQDVIALLDKQQGLLRVQIAGVLVAHDGCVGYTVRVDEALIHVHAQNIIGVVRESEGAQ